MSNDNDLYLNAFEVNANRKPKRRSSILKSVDVNYMSEGNRNDERRTSRRVSWAQTFQYKELHADGTTVIISQELKNKSSDETIQSNQLISNSKVIDEQKSEINIDSNEESVCEKQNKIIASDFINKLKKANNSMTETDENQTISKKRFKKSEVENKSESPKPKRAKKSNTKSLTNYLVKHYNTEDMKDYETVFNTSVNKYGRELIPRDEKPEITLLFNDQNNGMEITRVTNSSPELNNNSMAFSTNELSVRMSIEENESAKQSLDSNRTHCFVNDDMEITNKSFFSQNNQSPQTISNETTINENYLENQSDERITHEDMELSSNSSENQSKISSPQTNCNQNEVSIKVFETESTKRFFDEDMEMTCNKSEAIVAEDMEMTRNKSEVIVAEYMEMTCNKSKIIVADDMEITCNKSETIVAETDVSDDYEESNDSRLHTIHDTTMMSCEVSLDVSTENSLNNTTLMEELTNELHKSVEDLRRMSCKQSLTGNFDIPNVQFSKSAVTSEIQMALEENETNISHQFRPLSDIAEETTNYTQEMSMTAPIDCDLKTSAIEVHSELIEEKEESIRCEQTSKSSLITDNNISEEPPTKKTTQIIPVEEPKFMPSKIPQPMIRKNVLPTIQLPINVFSKINSEQNRRVSAPKLNMGWLAQTTVQLQSTSHQIERKSIQNTVSLPITTLPITSNNDKNDTNLPESEPQTPVPIEAKSDFNLTTTLISRSAARNSLTARLELAKSVVKDTFGFGITEKLKQKRDEFEAKRRQSNVNAFTPNSSNTVIASEARKAINFDSTKVATDLFELKNKTETSESMIIDEESSSESSVVETTKSDSSMDEEKDESLSSSSESQLSELTSTSPFSVSAAHSIDNYLVSSPQSVDTTLNFSFNPMDSSTDNFDPFIHTNQSFHVNSTFYESTSPLQLSFMVKEDTLCLLSDQLEREVNDFVIPSEESQELMCLTNEKHDMFTPLKKIDAKQNGFVYEVLNEEKALITYLWKTFALEIRFGNTIIEGSFTTYPVKEITSINMKSLVSAEEPLDMRQNDLILQFNECHKPLITIAHDLIISSFESERNQILNKYKRSSSLDELISDISVKVLSAKKLLSELRIISSTQICRLFPKQNDRYSLVVEILGIRNTFHLILPINPRSYPDEVIHPIFKIKEEDKHLYCLNEFSAALRMIDCRKFNYLQRLIKATKLFVRAKKKVIIDRQKKLKQKKEIENAKLSDE